MFIHTSICKKTLSGHNSGAIKSIPVRNNQKKHTMQSLNFVAFAIIFRAFGPVWIIRNKHMSERGDYRRYLMNDIFLEINYKMILYLAYQFFSKICNFIFSVFSNSLNFKMTCHILRIGCNILHG